jgi:hypothetical protein
VAPAAAPDTASIEAVVGNAAGATDAATAAAAGPGIADAALASVPPPAQAVVESAPAVGPPFDMPSAGPAPAPDPAALSPVHDDPGLNALAEYSPAIRLVVSAAIISSVVGARAAAGGSEGARRLAFTNARLVPCLVKASVERHLETVSAAVARGGDAAASVLRREDGGSVGVDVQTRIARLLEQVSDGFHDVVTQLPRDPHDGESADGLSDSRLMTQIGMLLGFVYLGFLTIWFWATRRHQEGRA